MADLFGLLFSSHICSVWKKMHDAYSDEINSDFASEAEVPSSALFSA